MRILAIILAIFHGANGLIMLFAPDLWYASVPDVTETGPLNEHFVRDIGLAFLAAAAALALFARDMTARVLIPPAAVFLGGHAGLHMVEMATHGTNAGDAARDLALIVLPGLLPLIFLRGALAEVRP
jgi:hypothetical protein